MKKIKDVGQLLTKHYGAYWRSLPNLQFYVDLESHQTIPAENQSQEADDMLIIFDDVEPESSSY